MSKYLISLTPIGKFFFGGDNTFSIGDENDKKNKHKRFNDKFSSYIIQSNLFPQQTSLLGMLRFLILSNNPTAFNKIKKEINNQVLAKELIGKKSFSLTVNHKYENSFGEIKSIGACFIQMLQDETKSDEWQNLLIAPLDYGYEISTDEQTRMYFNGKEKAVSKIEKYPKTDKNILYNPKEGIETLFIYKNSKDPLRIKDIFCKDIRVGINKDYDGKTKESAYYKQISYRLYSKYRFAFIADIDNFDDKKYNGQIVSLGGDSSQFIINTCKKIPVSGYTDEYTKQTAFTGFSGKVILSSPAFIKREESDYSRFEITDTLSFRFLKTKIKTQSYNIVSKEVMRSNLKYTLYKTGSVFYFKTDEQQKAFENALTSKKDFIQIGYNQFESFSKQNQ